MHASNSFAWLLSLGLLGTAVGEITGSMWTYDISKFPSEKLKKAIQPKGKRCNLVIQPSSLEGSTKNDEQRSQTLRVCDHAFPVCSPDVKRPASQLNEEVIVLTDFKTDWGPAAFYVLELPSPGDRDAKGDRIHGEKIFRFDMDGKESELDRCTFLPGLKLQLDCYNLADISCLNPCKFGEGQNDTNGNPAFVYGRLSDPSPSYSWIVMDE